MGKDVMNVKKLITPKRGMRVGGKHEWEYTPGTWTEEKIKKNKKGENQWKFKYVQTKHRTGKVAPKGSGFPIEGRLLWDLKAKQRAVKRDANTYDIITEGIKTQKGFKLPKDKKWR